MIAQRDEEDFERVFSILSGQMFVGEGKRKLERKLVTSGGDDLEFAPRQSKFVFSPRLVIVARSSIQNKQDMNNYARFDSVTAKEAFCLLDRRWMS